MATETAPVCCEAAKGWVDPADMRGRDHDGDCDNYDGAPDAYVDNGRGW